MLQGFARWTGDQLRGGEVPVRELIGDTDVILVANAAEMVELLPHSRPP